MSSVHERGALFHPAKAPNRPRPLPFWVVQATELIVAVIFVDISVHVRGGSLLVAAAAAFAVLAVTAQGPLGLVRLCPQRLHLTLVVAAAVVVAAAPLVPALRPDVEGIIVVEFGAVGLIRVATLTRSSDYRAGVAGTRRQRESARIIDATASVVDRSVPGDPSSANRRTGAPGHAAGTAPGGTAARSAGRAAGTATAAGRRLVAKHRPGAEARLKRSLRNAGRWAGRMTSSPADPETRAE